MSKNKEILGKYFIPYPHIYKLHFSPSCEIDNKKIKKCRRLLRHIIPKCNNLQKLDYGIGQVLESGFLKKMCRISRIRDSLVKINVHDRDTFCSALELFPNLRYLVKWKDAPLRGTDLVEHKSIRRLKSTPDDISFQYILKNKSLREVRLYVENLHPDNIEELFRDPKLRIIKTANMKESRCFSTLARNVTLREVSFSFMSIKEHRYLMQFLSLNRGLSTVWIDNSNIVDKDVITLMKRPLVGHLKKLNLSKNKITGNGCFHVFNENSVLENLNLSGNPMGSLEPSKIADFFALNRGITDLNLSKTEMQIENRKVIDSLVKKNRTLVTLEVHYSEEFLKSVMKESPSILQITCHFYSKLRVTQEWIRERDRTNVNFFGSSSQVKREELKAKKKKKKKKKKAKYDINGIPEEAFQQAIQRRKMSSRKKTNSSSSVTSKSSSSSTPSSTSTSQHHHQQQQQKKKKKPSPKRRNSDVKNKKKGETVKKDNDIISSTSQQPSSLPPHQNNHRHSNSVILSEVVVENRNHIKRLIRRAERLCRMKQYSQAITEARDFCQIRKNLNDQERKEIKRQIAMTLKQNDALFLVTCVRCRKIVLDIKRCSRCKRSYYCSREHQIEDWPDHKHVCMKRSLASQKRREEKKLMEMQQKQQQEQQKQQEEDDETEEKSNVDDNEFQKVGKE